MEMQIVFMSLFLIFARQHVRGQRVFLCVSVCVLYLFVGVCVCVCDIRQAFERICVLLPFAVCSLLFYASTQKPQRRERKSMRQRKREGATIAMVTLGVLLLFVPLSFHCRRIVSSHCTFC